MKEEKKFYDWYGTRLKRKGIETERDRNAFRLGVKEAWMQVAMILFIGILLYINF